MFLKHFREHASGFLTLRFYRRGFIANSVNSYLLVSSTYVPAFLEDCVIPGDRCFAYGVFFLPQH